MNARPFDDRVDQLALAFEERQQMAEVGLIRVVGDRLAQQIDLGFEIGLRVETAIDVGDEPGQLLALLFVDVELERLEQRMAGILVEELAADLERLRKVLVGQVARAPRHSCC